MMKEIIYLLGVTCGYRYLNLYLKMWHLQVNTWLRIWQKKVILVFMAIGKNTMYSQNNSTLGISVNNFYTV